MDNISTIHSTSDEWVVGRYGNGVRLFTPNEAQPNQYTLKRFKHMPFNAYLLTPDSAICWLNDNTAETMGFSSHASAHGKTMLDISPEENAMQVIKTDHIVIHHNLLQVIHDNIIRKDGMEHNFISIKVNC